MAKKPSRHHPRLGDAGPGKVWIRQSELDRLRAASAELKAKFPEAYAKLRATAPPPPDDALAARLRALAGPGHADARVEPAVVGGHPGYKVVGAKVGKLPAPWVFFDATDPKLHP